MQNRYSYLIKNTGILAISNFSSKVLVFLLVPLYTRVLTTSEYGIYDLVNTTVQLALPLMTVDICDAVIRYLMEKDIGHTYVVSVGAKFCTASVLLFSIIVGINHFFAVVPVFRDYTGWIIALFAATVFYQYATSVAKGLEEISDIAIAGIISTLVAVGCNIVFLVHFQWGIAGFFLANILGQFLPAVFLYFKASIGRYLSAEKDSAIQRMMVGYSAPLIMNNIGWWINNALDRYVVTFICGTAANGIFSVAYKIPTILATIQQIFMQAWQITAIKEYKNDSKVFYGKMMSFVNLAMGTTCIGLVFTTKFLAKFLYANEFYTAWKYVPFLLVSGVVNSASGVLGPILCADENSKALGQSTLCGAGLNIFLNFALVYAMGPQGATIATLLSSLAIYVFRRKAIGDKIEIENRGIMTVSWVLLFAQACVMVYLDSYLLQIFIAAIFFVLYRKNIAFLLRKAVELLEQAKQKKEKR